MEELHSYKPSRNLQIKESNAAPSILFFKKKILLTVLKFMLKALKRIIL